MGSISENADLMDFIIEMFKEQRKNFRYLLGDDIPCLGIRKDILVRDVGIHRICIEVLQLFKLCTDCPFYIHLFVKRAVEKEYACQQLQDENCGNSKLKGFLSDFVAKDEHAQQAARRTSQNGEQKQRSLRNPPPSADRPVFVHAENAECREINENEIIENRMHKKYLPFCKFCLL